MSRHLYIFDVCKHKNKANCCPCYRTCRINLLKFHVYWFMVMKRCTKNTNFNRIPIDKKYYCVLRKDNLTHTLNCALKFTTTLSNCKKKWCLQSWSKYYHRTNAQKKKIYTQNKEWDGLTHTNVNKQVSSQFVSFVWVSTTILKCLNVRILLRIEHNNLYFAQYMYFALSFISSCLTFTPSPLLYLSNYPNVHIRCQYLPFVAAILSNHCNCARYCLHRGEQYRTYT